jgi:hypothetical protein
MFLQGKVANVCRLSGLGDHEAIVRQARRIAVEKFEEQFGKSNLTIWRLCQLTDQNLMKIMLGQQPVRQPSTMMKPILTVVK